LLKSLPRKSLYIIPKSLLGLTKLGILYFNNDFGIMYRDFLGKDFNNLGGEITGNVAYDFSTTKLQTEIFQLINKESQALFFVGGKRENTIKKVREVDKDVLITTQFSIENPQTIDIAGIDAEGVIYAFDEENIGKIKDIITKKYPNRFDLKSDYYVSQSYLTMFILNEALQKCELTDTACMSNTIQNTNYLNEIGIGLNFNKNTWEFETNLKIKTVKEGEFIVVK
jgi:ABC-type branched-subunit amino acid transport system substrate-binding protein